MRSGELRHRVSIIRAASSSTSDSMGGYVVTWSTYLDAWASIEPLTSKETLKYKQIELEVTHKITLRYSSGLLPKMRLVYKSRYFDIVSARNLFERNVASELLCREVV
jgi:SPP1 family predicted phage head-tail adaptor